ncbi:MAG: FixH family protein [Bacteroidota bacterium]
MSWGNKIAVFYTIFAISMLSAVIFASMQTFHLVSEDYYQEEIAYQNRIQQIKNTEALEEELSWDYREGKELIIHFPKSFSSIEGSIHFYRPSDASMDQYIPIQLKENRQLIPTSKLSSGNWKVQVQWAQNGKSFYKEMNISM